MSQEQTLREAREFIATVSEDGWSSSTYFYRHQLLARIDAALAAPAQAAEPKDAYLLINQLILLAGLRVSQPADTPADDRITDADIDALEAKLRAIIAALAAAPQPAEPEGVAEVIQWVKAIRSFNIAHRDASRGMIEDLDSILDKLHKLAAPAATVPPALTDEQILACNYPDGEENGATIAAPDYELIGFARQVLAASGAPSQEDA